MPTDGSFISQLEDYDFLITGISLFVTVFYISGYCWFFNVIVIYTWTYKNIHYTQKTCVYMYDKLQNSKTNLFKY